jgi:hypothetical protein
MSPTSDSAKGERPTFLPASLWTLDAARAGGRVRPEGGTSEEDGAGLIRAPRRRHGTKDADTNGGG